MKLLKNPHVEAVVRMTGVILFLTLSGNILEGSIPYVDRIFRFICLSYAVMLMVTPFTEYYESRENAKEEN